MSGDASAGAGGEVDVDGGNSGFSFDAIRDISDEDLSDDIDAALTLMPDFKSTKLLLRAMSFRSNQEQPAISNLRRCDSSGGESDSEHEMCDLSPGCDNEADDLDESQVDDNSAEVIAWSTSRETTKRDLCEYLRHERVAPSGSKLELVQRIAEYVAYRQAGREAALRAPHLAELLRLPGTSPGVDDSADVDAIRKIVYVSQLQDVAPVEVTIGTSSLAWAVPPGWFQLASKPAFIFVQNAFYENIILSLRGHNVPFIPSAVPTASGPVVKPFNICVEQLKKILLTAGVTKVQVHNFGMKAPFKNVVPSQLQNAVGKLLDFHIAFNNVALGGENDGVQGMSALEWIGPKRLDVEDLTVGGVQSLFFKVKTYPLFLKDDAGICFWSVYLVNHFRFLGYHCCWTPLPDQHQHVRFQLALLQARFKTRDS